MKSEERKILREKFIELYLSGKNMREIAKITGCSRNYIGQVIKDDDRIKNYRNNVVLKIYKYKKRNKMNVPISVGFLEKIGISRNLEKEDYVDVFVDENEKKITIKKHEIK